MAALPNHCRAQITIKKGHALTDTRQVLTQFEIELNTSEESTLELLQAQVNVEALQQRGLIWKQDIYVKPQANTAQRDFKLLETSSYRQTLTNIFRNAAKRKSFNLEAFRLQFYVYLQEPISEPSKVF